jgi:hypothetical protein
LCRQLSAAAGLNYASARLDRSAHPFCGGTSTDIRITTRYDEADPLSAITGVLHETGHALYEQHLPAAWRRQPVGEAAGMATHESQSLIIEMQAVRSDAFLAHLAPLLTSAFNKPITQGALKRRLRHVERSCIRVEADELTYPAHVLLCFRATCPSPISPPPGTTPCKTCSASPRLMTPMAACKTSTGTTAPSAISPATRSAPWPPPNFLPPPAKPSPRSTPTSPPAISRP